MFSSTVGKSKFSKAFSEMSYFCDSKQPEKFDIPNRIQGDNGTNFFIKSVKLRLSREIRDECGSQIHSISLIFIPVKSWSDTLHGVVVALSTPGRTFKAPHRAFKQKQRIMSMNVTGT